MTNEAKPPRRKRRRWTWSGFLEDLSERFGLKLVLVLFLVMVIITIIFIMPKIFGPQAWILWCIWLMILINNVPEWHVLYSLRGELKIRGYAEIKWFKLRHLRREAMYVIFKQLSKSDDSILLGLASQLPTRDELAITPLWQEGKPIETLAEAFRLLAEINPDYTIPKK
jgi:hypothetical protein